MNRGISLAWFILLGLPVILLVATCGGAEEPPAAVSPTAVDTGAFDSPLALPSKLDGFLAFHSERSGTLQVLVLNGATGQVTGATSDPDGAFEPSWSPDCTSLVYASKRISPIAFELYVVGREGGADRRLTNRPTVDDWSPAWSPKGDVIAFQTNEGGRLNICFLTESGELLSCLAGDGNKATPAWSADGSRLLYTSDLDGDWDVYAIDYPQTTGATPLTANGVPDANPHYSPDGRLVVFSSKRVGNYDIFRIRADGTGEVQLTRGGEDDVTPNWVGNDRIVFASGRTSDWELYLMSSDGGGATRLTDRPGLDKWPVWCPAR